MYTRHGKAFFGHHSWIFPLLIDSQMVSPGFHASFEIYQPMMSASIYSCCKDLQPDYERRFGRSKPRISDRIGSLDHDYFGDWRAATNPSPAKTRLLMIIKGITSRGHKLLLQGAITSIQGSCNVSVPYPVPPYGRLTVLGNPPYPPAWPKGCVSRVQKRCEAREQMYEYNPRLGQLFRSGSKD